MALETKEKTKKKRKGISKELIYEMRKGSPIYYRDYDKVISGEKTLEEVMGSGGLQSFLVMLISNILFEKLKDKYLIFVNELGYKFTAKSWYNLDIAIIDKNKLKDIPEGYITVPPDIVIEIDTKADLKKFQTPQDYFFMKTEDLLNSGVKKVIWIFTKEKKLLVAEKGKRWFITDWNDTINVIDNIEINLEELLKKE